MQIEVHPVAYPDVEALRQLYRQECNCQIIHDSFVSRGLADPYEIQVNGRLSGYGAVSNKYGKGRVIEFYAMPHVRDVAGPMFCRFLSASGATHIEAQSNIPAMSLLLYDYAVNIKAENVLFSDAFATHWACPGGIFREAGPEDQAGDSEWVIESPSGSIVATGGVLCHYNPPYGDIYMAVTEPARRQGYGRYLVQELKRVCYEAGKKPAARCNPDNPASRRTLETAGLLPCGRLLAGEIEPQLLRL